MRFHHPAVPIVLAILLLDSIGFGIVLPVLPDLIVHLGQVSLVEATRIAGYMQGGMASIASVAAIVGPLAMTQALAFGAERGEPGGAFLLAPLLVLCALLIVVFGVVPRLKPTPEAG